MRLQLDATHKELRDKAPELLKALAGAVRAADPDLAENLENLLLDESLEKAQKPGKEPNLKFKVLRELQRQAKRQYQDQLQAMLDDVTKVLDSAVVQKSLTGESGAPEGDLLAKAGPFIGPRGGKWADPQHTIHWDEEKHGGKPQQLDLFADPAPQKKRSAREMVERMVSADAVKASWQGMSDVLGDLHQKLKSWHDGFDARLSRKKLVAQLDALEQEFLTQIPEPRIERVGGLEVETVDTTIEQQARDVGLQGIEWRRNHLLEKENGKYVFSMQSMREEPAMWAGLNQQRHGEDTVYEQGHGFTVYREPPQGALADEVRVWREKNWEKWEQHWRKEVAKQLADAAQLPKEHHELLAAAQVRTRFRVHKSVDNLRRRSITGLATVDRRLQRDTILITSAVDREAGLGATEDGTTLAHEIGHIVDFIVKRSSGTRLDEVLAGAVREDSDAAKGRVYIPGEQARAWATSRREWLAEAYRYVYRDGSRMMTTLQHEDFPNKLFRMTVDAEVKKTLERGVVLPTREVAGQVLNLPLPDAEELRAVAQGGQTPSPQTLESAPLDEVALVEQAHGAVKSEVVPAARRAVIAGADAASMKYLGAGGEAIIFTDKSGKAFKVSRRGDGKLRNEAGALKALQGTGLVPKLHSYDEERDVIVRDEVSGSAGTWGQDREIRAAYDKIVEKLKAADYSSPEYKEDSFVQDADGNWKMVDIGFVWPVGQRAVREFGQRMEKVTAQDDVWDLTSDLRQMVTNDEMTPEAGLQHLEKLERVFGKDQDFVSAARDSIESHQRWKVEAKKSLESTGFDYTEKVAQKDQARYTRIRAVLKQRGYTDADFDDEDGVLYGMSVNELVELINATD